MAASPILPGAFKAIPPEDTPAAKCPTEPRADCYMKSQEPMRLGHSGSLFE